MKRIIYFAEDTGIDGRAPGCAVFASFEETEVDEYLKSAQNGKYYRKREKIVDIEPATKQAKSKLDGVDKLLLNIAQLT